ncbi:MAG TPA: TonB-dependent receptor [Croceibacterium sp.]
MPALAQNTPDREGDDEEAIIVTGYRASLESSANAKRDSVGFTDTIFAEDIGKFPDTNIAESLNRIPGVTITREISGDGLNVAIRGLGTNFTRVLLNNAPIAIASTGRTDSQNTNREVDLDLFPTELFTQLTVHKSPTADLIEGGAAGVVNLRSARPFDTGDSGTRVNYSLAGTKGSNADDWGYRGHLLGSWVNEAETFGVLVGAAGVRNEFAVNGFESIGWTNANLSTPNGIAGTTNGAQNTPTAAQIAASQCRANNATCNATGGGNWTIPGTVPANAGNGLTTGQVINQDLLLQLNPGATIQQIDNGLIPRLARPAYEFGTRDRYNFIGSVEFRPSDAFHFYIDGMYGRKKNDMDRIDMNWVGRNGAAIPIGLTFDSTDCGNGCVVTGGTFANAQMFLEFRPYEEDTEFWGVNPGFDFAINDWITGDVQANYTKSEFRRDSPTVLVITPASSGLTLELENQGNSPFPTFTTNVDLNNPANFSWNGGRLNVQSELRETETKGGRANLQFEVMPALNIRVGGAWDDTERQITALDNSQYWQNAVCGNAPNFELPGPNRQPPCTGIDQPGTATPAGFPGYAAYGTGYSAGFPARNYAGSLIPQAELASYLTPTDYGFITVDWDRFKAASNYDHYLEAAPEAGSSNTGANGGYIREKVWAGYVEGNHTVEFDDDKTLRLNAGVRYVHTDQTIGGRVTITDPRNAAVSPACPGNNGNGFASDGSCYPNIVNFVYTDTSYENWLPSASGAFQVGDLVARASVSKTMTRPNPNVMLPGLNFSSPSADTGTVGNPALDPFLSTNIDLGVEYYTGGEGLIAVAAFRKSVTGFTVNGNVTVPFGDLAAYGVTYDTLTPTQQSAINARGGPSQATVVLTQQVNADGKLIVNGLEFQAVQPLDFATESFGVRGFGIQGNLTIIDQKGEGAGAPAIALGVAPTTYVLGGYYENGGVSARLIYTYNEGSQSAGANQNGIPNAALFGDSYDQLDFSGSLDFAELFDNRYYPTLTLDVINITKSTQRAYFQYPGAAFTYYEPGRMVMVGLRGSF